MRYFRSILAAIVFCVLPIQRTVAVVKEVSHSCFGNATDPNKVRVEFRILKHDDPIFKVYAFNAANGDTSMSTNRISDSPCVKDTSGITDKDTTPILYTINILVTDTTHACGAAVTTDASGIKIVTLLFRVYAYSDTLLSVDDDSYRVRCRMDDLTGAVLMSEQLDASAGAVITVLEPQNGAYLIVRKSSDSRPLSTATVGDKAYLSVEFNPEIELGPDNYGTHFFVGFLGNDPITGTTASQLYILLYPRYAVRTDISVTHGITTAHYEILDGAPKKLVLPADLMGCSDGGAAEIEDIGVEINSYEMEIGVLVCNVETGSADCYSALPVDITGKEYVTTSMFAANEASEMMMIGQEDGTAVQIAIPASSTQTITLNGSQTSAGSTLSITLNKRQAFHLAQTSSSATYSHVNGYFITSDKSISVISGNRKFANDHLSEQLPPTSKLGTSYVLTPADPMGDSRVTTYIVQAVASGDTVVTRYLTGSTSETHTITKTKYPPLQIDVAAGAPCELTSDKPILVTQVVNQPIATGFESAMVIMPAVIQWSPKYNIYHPDYEVTPIIVFKSPADVAKFKVNNNAITIQTTAVNGPSGYVYGPGITLPKSTSYTLKMNDDITTMMVIAYASNGQPSASDIGIAFLPSGYRYSNRGDCYTVGRRGDLRDNDCDGRIDEELVNALDDDGDGLIDEDTRASTSEHAGAVAIRPVNCRVSGDRTFPTGGTTITMTADVTGCKATGTGPFKPATDFAPQTGAYIGTGTKPKILYSGLFEIAMFLDKPKLYFICDIGTYCTSATDTQCTTGICIPPPGARKRREDITSKKPDNVTTDIWVFPYVGSKDKVTIKETFREATLQTCMDNTHIRVMFSLILIMAVLSFLTAVCFCCLFRKRNNRDKTREPRSGFYGWRNKPV